MTYNMPPNEFSLDIPPSELLARLQKLFREWGVFGQRLTLIHQGREYLALCEGSAFAIYRLNLNCHVAPGAPGWPVCLVTAEMAADETCAPAPEEDEFTCGLALQDWLDLIKRTMGK